MAKNICAICRFYNPYGNGTGYCSLKSSNVRHNGCCVDFQEQ